MKKQMIISSALLAIIGGTLVSPVTLAAEEVGKLSQANTTGDVMFEANDSKPEDEKWTAGEPKNGSQNTIENGEDGNFGNGALRLDWVPNFHFGKQKISSSNQEYSAKWTPEVIINKGKADEKKVSNYPQYVQVTDESGIIDSNWKVTVKQLPFKTEKDGQTYTLPNTSVKLYNTQAYNSKSTDLDSKKAKKQTEAIVTLTSLNGGVLLLDQEFTLAQSAKSVDNPKTETSNGSKTSIVFAINEQFNGDVSGTRDELNEAVKLFTPASDVKLVEQMYTADLVWNLESAL